MPTQYIDKAGGINSGLKFLANSRAKVPWVGSQAVAEWFVGTWQFDGTTVVAVGLPH